MAARSTKPPPRRRRRNRRKPGPRPSHLYIYRIECPPANGVYIGITNDPKARFEEHMWWPNKKMASDVKKHRKSFTFEIIGYMEFFAALLLECDYIKAAKASGKKCYNGTVGGDYAMSKKDSSTLKALLKLSPKERASLFKPTPLHRPPPVPRPPSNADYAAAIRAWAAGKGPYVPPT